MSGPLHHRLRGSGLPVAEYIGFTEDVVNRSVYTFVGVPIGVASLNRLVAVVVLYMQGTAVGLTSVTIGGNAAPFVTPGSAEATVAYLVVTSGATADIVVTLGATISGCAIGVYTVKRLINPVPVDSEADDAFQFISLTTIRDGITIGGTNTPAANWTGSAVVQDDDQGGLRFFHAVNTGAPITLSSSAGSGTIVGASWR